MLVLGEKNLCVASCPVDDYEVTVMAIENGDESSSFTLYLVHRRKPISIWKCVPGSLSSACSGVCWCVLGVRWIIVSMVLVVHIELVDSIT